jgi:hypothetical protein
VVVPQDHYVAKTYLRAFTDPKTNCLHAYSKRDSRYFTPPPERVCKTMDWDQNPKFLSPPDALGQWLKIFEPHWAAAVAKLEASHELMPDDKFVIAGYWAHLSTCTPMWRRVAADHQQRDLDTIYVERFTEHAQAHPHQFPKGGDYLPLLKDGKLKVEIDKDFPKALVTTQLLKHQWCLHHQAWDVVWNETDELFITSDNPSCFDYQYGSLLRAARYLPLTPRLALWTLIDQENIPEVGQNIAPANVSAGRTATSKFVRDMNRLVIQSAENIVLASEPKSYIPLCLKKYKNWKVCVNVSRIPTPDGGYFELIQTRASSA